MNQTVFDVGVAHATVRVCGHCMVQAPECYPPSRRTPRSDCPHAECYPPNQEDTSLKGPSAVPPVQVYSSLVQFLFQMILTPAWVIVQNRQRPQGWRHEVKPDREARGEVDTPLPFALSPLCTLRRFVCLLLPSFLSKKLRGGV